ncbi:kinase-like protein [Dendrothele bispora CBS 962.96]|uniref:non-specific serine/threonine protein kinase n=1 Tax=Dendrothele bispora (strain CBS 962.96) TaxID=1314807 RepID=A0A4S8MKP8_DENBC|nr:kinase-like protein [Dendrothele bispora CBS 962.96]
MDSSDPLSHSYDVSQGMQGYWNHLGNVNPGLKKRLSGKVPVAARSRVFNAAAADEQSDDLIIIKGEETPKANRKREAEEVEEEEEVEEVAVEEEQDVDGEEEEEDLDDDENTLVLKSPEEQEEILNEISDLEAVVPDLSTDYKLIDRLGTGTFSSVYKAIDLHYHTKWDNAPWHGYHPPSSSAYYQSIPRETGRNVYVAIKRIYVTSSPERIRNEIAILDECRGCRHVSQIITAFRKDDQVVLILPYQRNDDFRDYFSSLPVPAIKSYFRCLFRSLRDIHARGIIHRDVKPANFLFDPRTGIGTLCDFGLACRMEPGQGHNLCLHTPPSAEYPHGKIKERKDYDVDYAKKMSKEAKHRSGLPSDKVGYPEKDNRPHSKANRAGTRGFRPPEVLLKCGDQTGAVDMWAVGMILLSFLTRKFPLFQSNDDVEALVEIAVIIGRRKMERAAMLHNRMFSTNIPSVTPEGISWREFVERQNPDLYVPPEPDSRFYPYSRQLELHQQRQLQMLDVQERGREAGDEENSDGADGEAEGVDGQNGDLQGFSSYSSSPSRLGFNKSGQRRRQGGRDPGSDVDPSSATSVLEFPSSPPKSTSASVGTTTTDDFSPLGKPVSGVKLGKGMGLLARNGKDKVKGKGKATCFAEEFVMRRPSVAAYRRDMEDALDLMEKLMDHESTSRITPRGALYHPFLYDGAKPKGGKNGGKRKSMQLEMGMIDLDEDEDETREDDVDEDEDDWDLEDETEPEDDEFFPHPFGKGVCRKYHFRDPATDEPCVRVYEDDVDPNGVRYGESTQVDLDEHEDDGENDDDDASRRPLKRRRGAGSTKVEKESGRRRKRRLVVKTLSSGEGIAIGREPCEFHRVGYALEPML